MRRCLTLYGFTCLVGQVLALRELAVIFHGNELVYAAALGAWLVLVAAGSAATGKIAGRFRLGPGVFALLLAVCGLLVPLSLLLARTARWWAVGASGITPQFHVILLVTTLVLAPLCLALGAFYAVAGAIAMRNGAMRAEPPGVTAMRLFAFETLGAVIGGIAFTFLLVPWLDALLIALALGAADTATAFAVWWHTDRAQRPWGWAFLPVTALLLALLVSPLGRVMDFASQATRFPSATLRYSRDTPYGRIDAVTHHGQLAFYQNGVLTGATDMPAQAEETVLPALLAHRAPEHLLLIGGAVTGALEVALQFPRLRIDCLELDPALIAAAQRLLTGKRAAALSSDRVRLITGTDARRFLKDSNAEYDVIIAALPNPASGLLNRFYTREFFLETRQALHAGGIFAFSLDGAPDYMSEPHRALVAAVDATLRSAFGSAAVFPSAHAVHFIATARPHIRLANGRVFAARLAAQGIKPKWLTAAELAELTEPLRVARLRQDIRAEKVQTLNTSLHPLAYAHALRLWAETFEVRGRAFLSQALRLTLPRAVLAIVAAATFVAVTLVFLQRRTLIGVGAIRVSAGAAGFLLQMVLLFAFQSFCGYAYGAIALLFATFMVGAACGATFAGRIRADVRQTRLLMLLQIALALVAAIAVLLLRKLAGSAQPAAPLLIGLLNLAVGALVGAQYPLSVAACAETVTSPGRRASLAASLYALDLAGACLGALFGAALLIPALGMPDTAWVAAALCLAGLPLLLLAEADNRETN